MNQEHIVIIGASAAGLSCAHTLVSNNFTGTITVISAEQAMPYNKCLLADYCSGSKQFDEILTRGAQYFAEHKINVRLGSKVVAINRELRYVELHTGQRLSYSKLVLAIGTQPRNLPGLIGISGVYNFHTMEDVDGILCYVKEHQPKEAIVIGGGLSGLEAADALLAHGIQVTLVERSTSLIPGMLDAQSAEFLRNKALQAGVEILADAQVTQIQHDQGYITGIQLVGGREIACQLLIVAIGNHAQTELIAAAGITNEQGGIVVDEYMRTNDQYILAAGDCIITRNALTDTAVRSTLWPDAIAQGRVAALTILDKQTAYSGIVPCVTSCLFGAPLYCAGDVTTVEGMQVITHRQDDCYRRIIVDADKRVQGFCLINDRSMLPMLRRALMTQTPIDISVLRYSPTGHSG